MREVCNCSPFSMLPYSMSSAGEQQEEMDLEQLVPVPNSLKKRLRAMLDTFFPRSTPFSILLLHIAQFEKNSLTDGGSVISRRSYFHAVPGLLEQILVNVRRVIREADPILVYKGAAVALLLPDTDAWDARIVLERIYNSIGLLQAETVVPPLLHETIISMGIAAYPDPCPSVARLLYQAGNAERTFTLRPSVVAQLSDMQDAVAVNAAGSPRSAEWIVEEENAYQGVPFMELPKSLPQRLQLLVPYQVALQLRCVPVGREQRQLTVAMANPLDIDSTRRLQEITGMRIFPVACREEELATLLAGGW